MSSSSADRRSWRRASNERLRRAYLIVEHGFADLDRSSGRPAATWRQRADEVLERVYAELSAREPRDAS
jgi:hypothetical protein